MFGEIPKTRALSPLEQNNHSGLNNSELFDEEGIQQYQSLIRTLQWIILWGRYDIECVVMKIYAF